MNQSSSIKISKEIAKTLGLNQAVLLEIIQSIILVRKINEVSLKDILSETPFWNQKKVQKNIESLMSKGILKELNNKNTFKLGSYNKKNQELVPRTYTKFKGHEKTTLLLLSLLFCIGSVLAFYHFSIEQGFIDESFVCTNKSLSETLTKDQLLEQLKENTVSCKEISFKVFGLSLATINTFFSICLSAIFIRLFINYGKN